VNTILAASRDGVASFGVSATWLSRLRAARGYDLAVRLLGGGWFMALAIVVAGKAFHHGEAMTIGDFGPAGWPSLLASLCLVLFYVALCWLIILRSSPVASDEGVLPSFIAFVGSYLPWTIVLFVPGDASASQSLASAALLLIGSALMVFVIFHLGRCFSIVPQARTLVRRGPYAFVRNPLYLAEEVALLGALLQFYSPAMLALVLVHGALQVRRIFDEENLLRRTFPDYERYANSTPRLIPYVW
jgi:protein-S-isoprenylcysteine O-methyltransferase Ste14